MSSPRCIPLRITANQDKKKTAEMIPKDLAVASGAWIKPRTTKFLVLFLHCHDCITEVT